MADLRNLYHAQTVGALVGDSFFLVQRHLCDSVFAYSEDFEEGQCIWEGIEDEVLPLVCVCGKG